jgi:hypothetical protein
MFSKIDFIKMLEFFTDNILGYVWWTCFFIRESVFLWVSTALLSSSTCSFIRPLFVPYTGASKERKASSFNFMFRYKDDVLSLNNSNLVILFRIIVYPNSRPIELEIKDTTDTAKSVSYLDLHLDIDSGGR